MAAVIRVPSNLSEILSDGTQVSSHNMVHASTSHLHPQTSHVTATSARVCMSGPLCIAQRAKWALFLGALWLGLAPPLRSSASPSPPTAHSHPPLPLTLATLHALPQARWRVTRHLKRSDMSAPPAALIWHAIVYYVHAAARRIRGRAKPLGAWPAVAAEVSVVPPL